MYAFLQPKRQPGCSRRHLRHEPAATKSSECKWSPIFCSSQVHRQRQRIASAAAPSAPCHVRAPRDEHTSSETRIIAQICDLFNEDPYCLFTLTPSSAISILACPSTTGCPLSSLATLATDNGCGSQWSSSLRVVVVSLASLNCHPPHPEKSLLSGRAPARPHSAP